MQIQNRQKTMSVRIVSFTSCYFLGINIFHNVFYEDGVSISQAPIQQNEFTADKSAP